MKKYLLISLIFVSITTVVLGQVRENIFPYKIEHITKDKYVPYQYVREADVMWAKIVWEKIELSEKINQTLGLPNKPEAKIRNSRSLIQILVDAIQYKGILAYPAGGSVFGREFDQDLSPLKQKEVMEKLGDVGDGWDPGEVSSYLIKEVWFFDKQRSVLDVRIMGICPIRTWEDTTGKIKNRMLFWVKYNDVREYLAQEPVFWEQTDVMNISYDDIFQKRLFEGKFYMVSNPKNRVILDYKEGLDILVEAERLKQEMFNFEQDLWSY